MEEKDVRMKRLRVGITIDEEGCGVVPSTAAYRSTVSFCTRIYFLA